MEKNKLDKIFGPVGSSIGIIFLIVGIIMLFESFLGIILILAGALAGFSSTSSVIDIKNKKIKFSNNLFGVIPVGKWIDIKPDMKIGIKRSNRRWRTYSRSNRAFDLYDKAYILILYDLNDKEVIQIKKVYDLNSAKSEATEIADQLQINVK